MPSPTTAPCGANLPDVARQAAALARPLDWVGMEEISLPVCVPDGRGGQIQVAAKADLFVDLKQAAERGIHMSRLYLCLQRSLAGESVTPPGLRQVLQSCIESQGVLSSRAWLRLRFEALIQRNALESDYSGWKRYPAEIEAILTDGHLQLTLGLSVEYSSTCPASAALSRQANAERFVENFSGMRSVSVASVKDWLASEQGMAATPHAQRSQANVRIQLRPRFDDLPLLPLIDALEGALTTPVQTAVKREDELAFARLNASNLMFCEDAARRVAAVLAQNPQVEHFDARVVHYESLHPHDAVARISGNGSAASP
ncbi:MAG: GTP cyclohydrolase FolE2 [Xanthomonadaceae bacterium]|nr:GTP cyclohydrolase FolE2 [Xanthomonadaceae bacterium]